MKRVAIIGAGVGGLSTAITLRQAGIDAHIYEQTPTVTEVGAGIALGPNAVRLLERMGVGEALRACAAPPTAHFWRRWSDGSVITSDRYDTTYTQRYGTPPMPCHRGELVAFLADALPEESIHCGYRFTGLRQHPDHVEVEFEGGGRVEADVLIGADGIRSSVAQAIGTPTVPRKNGLACYRGIVSVDRLSWPGAGSEWTTTFGPDSHFVSYPISSGRALNFVGIIPSGTDDESWTAEGDVDEARAFYSTWHEQIRDILSAADRVTIWGLFDRPARDRWSVGRVALLGDSAHPMLPFMAQGAAQAIEDAATLAALLQVAADDDVPRALERYVELRLPRVRRIQDLATRNATMFHLHDGPEQRERDARIAHPDGGDPWRNNAWIFDHDPVALIERDDLGG